MPLRFGIQSGGLSSGILFAPQTAFLGVTGAFSATLNPAIVSATGATAQVYTDAFDVSINVTPNFSETFYEGSIGTFSATLNPVIMVANEGAVTDGAFAATLNPAVVSATGAHITPVTGTFHVTLNPVVITAGATDIGMKFSDVTLRSVENSDVTFRSSISSDITIH